MEQNTNYVIFDDPCYWNGNLGYRPDTCGRGYRDFPINQIRAEYIASFHPTSVLEIGCAAGFVVEKLRAKGIDAWGLDVSKYAIEQMSSPQVRPFLTFGLATCLPWPDKRFDMVVSFGTLEHLTPEDCEKAISEILRVSRRGIIGVCLSTGLASTLPKDQQDATHRSLHDYYWWKNRFSLQYIIYEDTDETFRHPKNEKILIIAPSAYAIDISKYGGIERLTYLISQEMAMRGVDVTVAAPTGSLLPRGVKFLDSGPANAADFVRQEMFAHGIIFPYLEKFAAILDLTHGKLTGRHLPYSLGQCGVIWHMPSLMQPPEPEWNVIALSNYQAESYFQRQGRKAKVLDIHCAAPNLKYRNMGKVSDRFIFIGRLHPTKGALVAARFCNKLGVPLDIIGAITPAEPPDYVSQVKEEAKRGDIKFWGELPYDSLTNMLAEARALLFPIAPGYEEAHSHKAVDALCLGVPVIAYKRGALPEVITYGVDGWLDDTPEQFMAHMSQVDILDRAAIKARSWERWDPAVVVNKLLSVLQDVSRGARWG